MKIKGYWTSSGYLGLVHSRWMLFVSESEYIEYVTEEEDDES